MSLYLDSMGYEFNLNDGKYLIELARFSILSKFEQIQTDSRYKEVIKYCDKFSEKLGIFVTLTVNKNLRGCIGYPEPILSLKDALIEAAKSAAFKDPRFNPLKKEEFDEINVELSILSVPELIKVDNPKDYPSKIKVGVDGLIIKSGLFSGLLLPQVATEYSWTEDEFLEHACLKAGLAQDAWLDSKSKIYSFQAEIFSEDNGKIVKKN